MYGVAEGWHLRSPTESQAFNYLMEVNVPMEQGKPGRNREWCIMLRADFTDEPMGWAIPQDVCLARVFLTCWFSARMNVGPGEFLIERSDGCSYKGEGCRKWTPTLFNNVGRSSAGLRVWRNIAEDAKGYAVAPCRVDCEVFSGMMVGSYNNGSQGSHFLL